MKVNWVQNKTRLGPIEFPGMDKKHCMERFFKISFLEEKLHEGEQMITEFSFWDAF